jgi:hypothetical protein
MAAAPRNRQADGRQRRQRLDDRNHARSDGKPQVTYNADPLYLYAPDQNPGDATGQGLTAFGAAWFAVSPAGNQVSEQATGSGGSGGTGY